MPRRYVPALLALFLTLTSLSVLAEDFWLTKDWKQWSKEESTKILTDSAWAKTWRANGNEDGIVYIVQLRSALPVREAIVRRLQFDQKYDKMTEVQRNAFDVQAAKVLDRSYDDAILVHVDFSKSNASPNLRGNFKQLSATNLDASLVTDDGNQVKSIRFDMNDKAFYEFDLLFPKLRDGTPVIKDGQKRFSVQFQSPRVDLGLDVNTFDSRSQRVRVDFDLAKMAVGNKLTY
jgi:hypothetical protein